MSRVGNHVIKKGKLTSYDNQRGGEASNGSQEMAPYRAGTLY